MSRALKNLALGASVALLLAGALILQAWLDKHHESSQVSETQRERNAYFEKKFEDEARAHEGHHR
jgi:hypothetical protein